MSKKRKKKSPLRNEFTDALNAEMAERKIIERTQPKVEPVEVSEISTEKISLEKVDAEKIEVEKATKIEVPKIEVEKIAIEKVEEIPVTPIEVKEKVSIVEVKIDSKLEKRILKEAENTFHDEKPSEPAAKKSIYRSKSMQRWEAEQRGEEIPKPKVEKSTTETPIVETPRKMNRAEKFGGVVALVMLIYAFANFDKPLFFLSMALFANFLKSAIGAMFGKHNQAVQNALHSFSIVVFFGALFFLFTD